MTLLAHLRLHTRSGLQGTNASPFELRVQLPEVKKVALGNTNSI